MDTFRSVVMIAGLALGVPACDIRDPAITGQDSRHDSTSPTSLAPMDQRVPITGTVTSTDGSPVAGAMIDPLPLDGQDAAAIEAFHRSLEDGRFEMLLAPGRWDLSVTANGYESISQRIEVPTAGDLQVAVVLAPA